MTMSPPFGATDGESRKSRSKFGSKYTPFRTTFLKRTDLTDAGFITIESDSVGHDIFLKPKEESAFFMRVVDSESADSEIFFATVGDAYKDCVKGYDFFLLAYGATQTGKTRAIYGDQGYTGIMHMFMDRLALEHDMTNPSCKVKASFSFFNVKGSKITDYLDQYSESSKCRMKGLIINNVSEYTVKTGNDIDVILSAANARRPAVTEFYGFESSTTVGCITVRSENTINNSVVYAVSRNYFVDMISSPNNDELMNPDLHLLNRTLNNLNTDTKTDFTFTALTQLLEPCLKGAAFGSILLTMNPSTGHEKDYYNTLEFYKEISVIRTNPVLNYEPESVILKPISLPLNSPFYSVAFKRPVGPCIVELFNDYSMSYWRSLPLEYAVKAIPGRLLFKFSTNDHNELMLQTNTHPVDVNNKTITVKTSIKLKHQDLVVYNGCRIFVALLTPPSETFDDYGDLRYAAFLSHYHHLIAEKNQIEFQSQLVNEAKDDFKELKMVLKKETLEMQQEMQVLMKKKAQANTESSKIRAATALTALREDMLNHENIFKDIKTSITNVMSKKVVPLPDNFSSSENLNLRGLIDNINTSLKTVAESTNICFNRNLFHTDGNICVRVMDNDAQLYSDMTVGDFYKLYDTYYKMQETGFSATTIGPRFLGELFCYDLMWKRINEPGASIILTNVVSDSLKVTATKRKSSVAEVQAAFNKRNSIISRISAIGVTDAANELDSFSEHLWRYLNYAPDIPSTNNVLDMILQNLCELQRQFSFLRIGIAARTIQKRALITAGVAKFQGQISVVANLLYMLESINKPEGRPGDLNLDIALDEMGVLDTAFRTWLRLLVRSDRGTTDAVDAIETCFRTVVQNVGAHVFSTRLYLPNMDIFNGIAKDFYEGILWNLEALLNTITLTNDPSEVQTYRVLLRLLTGKILCEVSKYISAKENFNTLYYLKVILPSDKYKQIVPSKFLAIANFIERNFQQATGRDLVDSLRNVARVMKP